MVARGHTRLPQYLAGRVGTIVAFDGTFPLPDERALGAQRSAPQPVYAVRFECNGHHVTADLWEAYLETSQ